MPRSIEEQEIESVLRSEAFSASPNQARLLKYLCDNHFSDSPTGLNEYRIGVEALGRPTDFDPARNSCVRVDIHRLRSRLRKYYETEGSNHPLRVILEDGRYALRFVSQSGASAIAASDLPAPEPLGEAEDKLPQKDAVSASVPFNQTEKAKRRLTISWKAVGGLTISVLVVAIAVVSYFMLRGSYSQKATSASSFVALPMVTERQTVGVVEKDAVRILAGYLKPKYVDREGRTWGGDRYFSGGEVVDQEFPYIQGTIDATMFRTARMGEFSYDIPVGRGPWELRMYFAETTFGPGTVSGGGESSRVFGVFLNDRAILTNFDVVADAGGNNRALTRVFKDVVPASDGKIHLRFHRKVDQPLVNAIELLPEVGGKATPLRIVMQDDSYVDPAGHFWEPDHFAVGGMLIPHHKTTIKAVDPHLFDGERFGHFTYQIPEPPGRYTATLYFSESYFGTERSRPDDGDARLFDICANGMALLRNYDISKQAGGPNKGVVKTFHALEPNAAGLIVLEFIPVKNYASLNAIEMTEESK